MCPSGEKPADAPGLANMVTSIFRLIWPSREGDLNSEVPLSYIVFFTVNDGEKWFVYLEPRHARSLLRRSRKSDRQAGIHRV